MNIIVYFHSRVCIKAVCWWFSPIFNLIYWVVQECCDCDKISTQKKKKSKKVYIYL